MKDFPNINILCNLDILNELIIQQQLASILPFTPWQTVQIMSVSWQLSTQNGMQQQQPVKMNRPKHQIQVTPPGAFLGKLWVYLLQKGQI